MRQKAEQFMQYPIELYDVSIHYGSHGEQTTVSGLIHSTTAYIGALSGKDQEFVATLERQGVKTSYYATILIPLGHPAISDNYVIRASGKNWSIEYHSDDTMPGVQLYTKIIAKRMTITDERELP